MWRSGSLPRFVHNVETACNAFHITDNAHRDDTLKSEFPGPQACVCSCAQYGAPSHPLDYVHPTHTRIGNSDGFLWIDDVPDVDVGI